MSTKYIVDNISGQTINGEPILRPYKVYTALLTQSGGDDPLQLTTGPVTKGVTYLIVNSAGDFSNVGAPNNNDGTYFVATNNETPNDYGLDGQLMYDNGAPVVTVLENTIGNIWFTWNGNGQYYINSNGLFTTNKTVCSLSNSFNGGGGDPNSNIIFYSTVYSNSTITIFSPSNGTLSDGLLFNTPIEIRVYN